MKNAFLLLVGILMSAVAHASSPQIGTPQYFGSGCPKGSVSTTFAPDNSSFSIIYDQFSVEIAADSHTKEKMRYCDVRIPIQLPAGTAVTLTSVDYRGFVSLPKNGKALFQAAQEFFPPSRDWRNSFGYIDQVFKNEIADDYYISTADENRKPTSACGGKVYLHLNEALWLKAKKGGDAQITLDSADGNLGSVYSLQFKKCK